ncbi:MAG: RDD family protein [Saprospiraceae bacterium]|nr:RDD family protein [Saprospiraceae bacterium]
MDNKENFEEQLDYFNKPNLVLRVKSMRVDSFIIIALMYVAFLLLDNLGIDSGKIKGTILGLIFLYEPILTSINRTIGQKIMGLRVRTFGEYKNNGKRINISMVSSIIRYITKILLGWISLLTIHSDKYGQAIHDKIGNS